MTFVDCALSLERDVIDKMGSSFHEKFKNGFRWFISRYNIFTQFFYRTRLKIFKFFKLISDNQVVLDKLLKIKKYSTRIVYANRTDSGQIGHVETNVKAYTRTILDNELLSKCNELVMTGGSTFGFVASMKMSKMPYFINGKVCSSCDLMFIKIKK